MKVCFTNLNRQHLRAILLVSLALLLGGCLSRPNLTKESFAFATPPPSSQEAPTNGPVLGIRRISVAPPFDSQSLTYRTGAFSYERDPYAAFLVTPDESLAEPIRAYFRNSGFFRAVTEPDSDMVPTIQLEITASQLYGDFRDHAHPSARLQMRFLAFKAGAASRKVLLDKDYTRNIPLQARTAAALVAGWNEALKQIATEAARDLSRAALDK